MKRRNVSLIRSIGIGLRNSFVQNAGLKGICLACALLLVAYQRSQEDERTRTVAFSIDAQLPGPGKRRELMTPIPPSVRVTVQGSTRALEELATATPSLELDLRDGRTSHVRLLPELFDLPPGVSVKLIEPTSLDFEWQDIITREVPVQCSVTGSAAEGHEVSKLTVEPDVVELSGPQGLVRVAQFVRVAPFDISGLATGTYNRTLALDSPPGRTNYADRQSVTVSVEIRRRLTASSFPRLAVEVVGVNPISVIPARVDVTVKGPPEVVARLVPELVIPRVDLSEIGPGKHGSIVLPVSVDLSNASAEIQPPTVKVTW